MSTYSSLVSMSAAFEKLFKILGWIFGALTLICVLLASYVAPYIHLNGVPIEIWEDAHNAARLFAYIPAVISLILTVANYVASRIVHRLCVGLTPDNKK